MPDEHDARAAAAIRQAFTGDDPAALNMVAARTATALCEIIEVMRALNTEVAEWRACARHDPDMSGKHLFKGWDRSALDRCRRKFIDGLL